MKINKQQWKKWTLPSKASYVGLWFGIFGTIFGIVGVILAIYFYINPPATPPSNCDKFVQTQNPTDVELLLIRQSSWVGDFGKYLTFRFENLAKVPAHKFKISLSVDGEKLSSDFPTEYNKIDTSLLSIKPGKTEDFPIIPIHVIEKKFNIKICGFGVKPLDFNNKKPDSCRFYSDVSNKRMFITHQYETVFNEKIEKESSFFAYIW